MRQLLAADFLSLPSQAVTSCYSAAELSAATGTRIDRMTTISEPVRAGRCLAPVLVYPPGRPDLAVALAGLVDTGANRSAITSGMAQLIGLPAAGTSMVQSPLGHNGPQESHFATLEFWLQGFGPAARPFNIVLSNMASPMVGATMLIGMDVLQHGEFLLQPSGIWNFTF